MNNLKAKVYDTVGAIETEHWASLGCAKNLYFSSGFLKAFETSNSHIDFRYILIFNQENQSIAIATIQIIDISIDSVSENLSFSAKIQQKLQCLLSNRKIKVLFCGNVFLSGEHGIFIAKDQNKKEVFTNIVGSIKKLTNNNNGLKKIDVIFIKDFKVKSLEITNQLNNFRFSSMQVEPNMILSLSENWNSFEDYKNVLKSKYRIKVNKANQKSEALHIKDYNKNDIIEHLEKLQKLYENTARRSSFNPQILNLETYARLKANLKDNFFVRAYFLEDKLVGFMSALINQNHLDAHFIGIDYEFNKQYAIYPRILNDYVTLGIDSKIDQINFGRTASEIKSTLGAIPEELVCYLRHKKSLTNFFIKPFISKITIKNYKQHSPFKQKKRL